MVRTQVENRHRKPFFKTFNTIGLAMSPRAINAAETVMRFSAIHRRD